MLLTTDRLAIRRFRPSDAPVLAAYRSDPEVARYQSWSPPVSVAEAAALIHEVADADPRVPGWFQYAIELRDGQALIGDIGVNLHDNRKQAEIGFTLATAFHGKGYAFEAVRRVLDHLFTGERLHRVSAECDARNLSSARLLERLGFTREGYRKSNTWLKNEWTDDLLFGLLAADWH